MKFPACMMAAFMVMALAAAAVRAASGQELVILNWAEYMDPALLEAFEQQHGVKVREVYYDDDDDRDQLMIATDGVGYDLAIVNETMMATYRGRGWIVPMTRSQVPNLKHIDRRWQDNFPEAAGYAAPYFWGTLGIAYRKDLVASPPSRWLDLLQPAAYLRGKIAMFGSQRETIGMALKALGYSANSTAGDEVDQALALLLKQKPFVRAYETAVLTKASELVTGDIVMRMMFSGDALVLKNHHAEIEYIVPEEGSTIWIDYLTVLTGSTQQDLAYALVNFLNEPEHAAALARYVSYATPNLAAVRLMSAAYRADPIIYPDAATIAKSEMFTTLPPRALSWRNTQFSRLLD